MDELRKLGDRLVNAVSTRTFHAGKYLYQALRPIGSAELKRIVFILGCQRSGTTLMKKIFDKDLNAKVYGEFSEITRTRAKRNDIRLKPLDEVKALVQRERASLIVAKPIAETQNALRLLAFFPGSKALFMYRHYAAVAASNLKLFGRMNGVRNLRPLVNGESADWRAEGVAPEVRALVAARFNEAMDPYDAAALFWYVRNRFFFDLGLDRHPAVRPLRYEALAQDPAGMIEHVYRFVGTPRPAAGAGLVHSESSGKGRDVRLSPDIEQLCRELLERLDRAYAQAWTHSREITTCVS